MKWAKTMYKNLIPYFLKSVYDIYLNLVFFQNKSVNHLTLTIHNLHKKAKKQPFLPLFLLKKEAVLSSYSNCNNVPQHLSKDEFLTLQNLRKKKKKNRYLEI